MDLIYTKYHLEKLVHKVYHLQKTDLIVIVILWNVNGFFNGKLSSELNLIFM